MFCDEFRANDFSLVKIENDYYHSFDSELTGGGPKRNNRSRVRFSTADKIVERITIIYHGLREILLFIFCPTLKKPSHKQNPFK